MQYKTLRFLHLPWRITCISITIFYLSVSILQSCKSPLSLIVDPNLQSVEKWEIKRHDGGAIRKYSFGPYKVTKVDKTVEGTEKNRYGRNGILGSLNPDSLAKTKHFQITVESPAEIANAVVELRQITRYQRPGLLGKLVFNQETEMKMSKRVSGSIQTSNDSTTWQYSFQFCEYGDELATNISICNASLFGDSVVFDIDIRPDYIHAKKKNTWQYAFGLIIKNAKAEQVAVLNTVNKKYIMISKDLPPHQQLVIASFLALVLGVSEL